jgi:hypothetical protein
MTRPRNWSKQLLISMCVAAMCATASLAQEEALRERLRRSASVDERPSVDDTNLDQDMGAGEEVVKTALRPAFRNVPELQVRIQQLFDDTFAARMALQNPFGGEGVLSKPTAAETPLVVVAANSSEVLLEQRIRAEASGDTPAMSEVWGANAADLDEVAVVIPADVEYRVSAGDMTREEVIAVTGKGGEDVVASAFRSAEGPVEIAIESLNLKARQLPPLPNQERTACEVSIGEEKQILAEGQVSRFPNSGLTVALQTSIAGLGAEDGNREGADHALRLRVWSSE